jgi:CelD/BcsL family acetyltransferase involved in cellulose biosynthesis
MGGRPMRVSVIRPGELGPADIESWHSMQLQNTTLLNPFLCPEFAQGVGQFQSDTQVAVLMEGADNVGFFPFARGRFGAGKPIASVLNNCQGVVCRPDSEWDARALLTGCRLSTWEFDKLPAGLGPFAGFATEQTSAAVIDLSDGFAAYRDGFQQRSSKFLKRLNRKTRNLEEAFGDIQFKLDSRDPDDLRTLMAWKSEQCRNNGWLDVFERPWVVGLVDYLFGVRTEYFNSTLSMMHVGGTPAAAQLCLRSGTFLAGWYTAYNPKFGDYSPGLIQFIRAAEGLAEAGVKTFEFGGSDFYQEKLKNGDIHYSKGTAATGRLAAGMHTAQAEAGHWARRQIRRSPFTYRIADRVLKSMGKIA